MWIFNLYLKFEAKLHVYVILDLVDRYLNMVWDTFHQVTSDWLIHCSWIIYYTCILSWILFYNLIIMRLNSCFVVFSIKLSLEGLSVIKRDVWFGLLNVLVDHHALVRGRWPSLLTIPDRAQADDLLRFHDFFRF